MKPKRTPQTIVRIDSKTAFNTVPDTLKLIKALSATIITNGAEKLSARAKQELLRRGVNQSSVIVAALLDLAERLGVK